MIKSEEEWHWVNEHDERNTPKRKAGDIMNVNIKRLHADAVIPQYAHETDAGFDLVAVEDVIVEPGETAKVPTGLAFEIPAGYELQIRPRSGITSKTKLRVQLGTVDAGYRGEVSVIVDNISPYKEYHSEEDLSVCKFITGGYDAGRKYEDALRGSYVIRKGDRIAQGVIAPIAHATFTEVDELGGSERGEGGFGSSGVKSTKTLEEIDRDFYRVLGGLPIKEAE